MHIEITLLVLESVLLLFTIVLLLYSIKEGKRRKALLVEVGRVTKTLTRQEYFLNLIDVMQDAEEEVLGCITGRLAKGEDKKRARSIVSDIEKLTGKGVAVKYLLPKFPDRLNVGYRYSKAGADVRFSSCLFIHDVRFTVVDGRMALLGIPESVGERESTKKGYRILSEGLATILKDYFLGCWDNSLHYEDYIREIVSETGASAKVLAMEFHIDADEILRIVPDCKP